MMLNLFELKELLSLADQMEGQEISWVPLHSFEPQYALLKDVVIEGVFTSEDESEVIFKTSEGFVEAVFSADCCSNTWLADFFGFNNLIDSPIRTIEDIPLVDSEKWRRLHESRQEVDELYGIKFVTAKGSAVMSFRNSSNGYYGGSLSALKKVKEIKPRFRQILPNITGFWQAG